MMKNKRKLIYSIGALATTVLPLSTLVISCGSNSANDFPTDEKNVLATILGKDYKLGEIFNLVNQRNETENKAQLNDINNKMIFWLYKQEQVASKIFFDLRDKLRNGDPEDKHIPEPPKPLKTQAELRKDVVAQLTDERKLVQHNYGIHNWEKPWAEELRKKYGGALNENQAEDFILRQKIESDALRRFTFESDSNTFIRKDFFKTDGTFITNNKYGVKAAMVTAPAAEINSKVYVFETTSFIPEEREGLGLQNLYKSKNSSVVPTHFLLPIKPGPKPTDPWVASKGQDLVTIFKNLIFLTGHDNFPTSQTDYTNSTKAAKLGTFKGLQKKTSDIGFKISESDISLLNSGIAGNKEKSTGGSLGASNKREFISSKFDGNFAFGGLFLNTANPSSALGITPNTKDPFESIASALFGVLGTTFSNLISGKRPKDDGKSFNRMIERAISDQFTDQNKLKSKIGEVFRNAFMSTAPTTYPNGMRSLIYRPTSGQTIIVSSFGVHIINQIVDTDNTLLQKMLTSDLQKTGTGKKLYFNIISKLNSFIESSVGPTGIKLFVFQNMLANSAFVTYLKTEVNNAIIDRDEKPTGVKYNQTLIDQVLLQLEQELVDAQYILKLNTYNNFEKTFLALAENNAISDSINWTVLEKVYNSASQIIGGNH